MVRWERLVSIGDLLPDRGVAHAFGLPALGADPRPVTVRPETCQAIEVTHPTGSMGGCGGMHPSQHWCYVLSR